MWYIYTTEYYSDINKHEIMPFTRKWMELEIMLSKISQAQKYNYHVFTHIQNLVLKQ
jgi:hypothetical protein